MATKFKNVMNGDIRAKDALGTVHTWFLIPAQNGIVFTRNSVTFNIVISRIFALSDAILKHDLSSEYKAVDKQKRRGHRNPVPTFVLKYKLETYVLEHRYLVQGVFSLVPSNYLTLAPRPGTKCEGCLRKPKHTKEHIKKDSNRYFAKNNSENSELKPNLIS